MVAAPEGTAARDPEAGLRHALRAVELNPHPDYIDTLAEAYLANGLLDEAARVCKEMLERSPGNRVFIDRLERIKRMRE